MKNITNLTTPLLTRFLTMFGMTKGNLFPNLTVLRSYDLTILKPGIYFVKISTDGGSAVVKRVAVVR